MMPDLPNVGFERDIEGFTVCTPSFELLLKIQLIYSCPGLKNDVPRNSLKIQPFVLMV
jgi:hypothetical protein